MASMSYASLRVLWQTLWVRIPLSRGVIDIKLCYKVCQWLATGRWFSPGSPASSTNKTDRHDVTEILLKVALNTITLPYQVLCLSFLLIKSSTWEWFCLLSDSTKQSFVAITIIITSLKNLGQPLTLFIVKTFYVLICSCLGMPHCKRTLVIHACTCMINCLFCIWIKWHYLFQMFFNQ